MCQFTRILSTVSGCIYFRSFGNICCANFTDDQSSPHGFSLPFYMFLLLPCLFACCYYSLEFLHVFITPLPFYMFLLLSCLFYMFLLLPCRFYMFLLLSCLFTCFYYSLAFFYMFLFNPMDFPRLLCMFFSATQADKMYSHRFPLHF